MCLRKSLPSVFLILVLLVVKGNAFSLRPQVQKIVQQLEKGDAVEDGYVLARPGCFGPVGEDSSEYYPYYLRLQKLANRAELVELLHHPKTQLQVYAAWALAEQHYATYYQIFEEMLLSQQKIFYNSSNAAYTAYCYDLLYIRMVRDYEQRKVKGAEVLYYARQLDRMDSILLHQPTVAFIHSEAVHMMLVRNKAHPARYSWIREFALQQCPDSSTKDGNQAVTEMKRVYWLREALAAVASYHYEEDIDTILHFGSDALRAIAEFPHPRFWSYLTHYSTNAYKGDYYEAVAAYKSAEAAQILEKELDSIALYSQQEALRRKEELIAPKNKEALELIGIEEDSTLLSKKQETDTAGTIADIPTEIRDFSFILTQYNTPLYRHLALRLWQEYSHTNPWLLHQLLSGKEQERKELRQILLSGMFHPRELSFTYALDSRGKPIQDSVILQRILQFVGKLSRDSMIALCAVRIKHEHYDKLRFFCHYVRKNKLHECSLYLQQSLENKYDAMDSYYLAETLLAFSDATTRATLVKQIEKVFHNWYSMSSYIDNSMSRAKWLKAFSQLFKQYNMVFHGGE